MTQQAYVDAGLKLLEILVACAWPGTLLFVLVFFRRELIDLINRLEERLTKAEVIGSKFEFSSVELNALKEAVNRGAEEYKGDPEKLKVFVHEQVDKLPRTERIRPTPVDSTSNTRSILWVDDNPINNSYEASVLKQLGASIVTARSTAEAKALFLQGRFDLVISDIVRVEAGRRNPEAGFELLKDLKHASPGIRVLFYTSNVARVNRESARDAYGIVDSPTDLINLASNALGIARN